MSLGSRILLLLKVKFRAALDQVESPQQVFDYTYKQQQKQLIKTKRALIEIATAIVRLEQRSQTASSRTSRSTRLL